MPLAKNKVRSVAGSSACGPVCPNGEIKTSAALGLSRRRRGGIVSASAKILRPAFADDQIGGRERCRRVAGDDRLAVVEIVGERGRIIGVDAGDIGADIGKQTPAHGGGQALADLDHAKPCQQ